jgi:hypothetical protein
MSLRRHQSQLSFLTDDQPSTRASKGQLKSGKNGDNGNLSGDARSKSKWKKATQEDIKSSDNNSPSQLEVQSQKRAASKGSASAAYPQSQSTGRGKKGSSKSDSHTRMSKERLTVHLSQELINRIRNAVYWTPGLTLADLGEDAFTRVVAEREKQRGGAFPQRKEELKGGRPIK